MESKSEHAARLKKFRAEVKRKEAECARVLSWATKHARDFFEEMKPADESDEEYLFESLVLRGLTEWMCNRTDDSRTDPEMRIAYFQAMRKIIDIVLDNIAYEELAIEKNLGEIGEKRDGEAPEPSAMQLLKRESEAE